MHTGGCGAPRRRRAALTTPPAPQGVSLTPIKKRNKTILSPPAQGSPLPKTLHPRGRRRQCGTAVPSSDSLGRPLLIPIAPSAPPYIPRHPRPPPPTPLQPQQPPECSFPDWIAHRSPPGRRRETDSSALSHLIYGGLFSSLGREAPTLFFRPLSTPIVAGNVRHHLQLSDIYPSRLLRRSSTTLCFQRRVMGAVIFLFLSPSLSLSTRSCLLKPFNTIHCVMKQMFQVLIPRSSSNR
jgi:hypothetical protein